MNKILVASSDPELLSAVSRPLAATKDYHVSWAYDGFDVQSMFGESQYAGIVIEMSLPGPALIEICGEIKAKNPDIPILLIAESKDEMTSRQAEELNATDFIKKPIFSVTLIKKIKELLTKNEGPQAAAEIGRETEISEMPPANSPENDILSRIYKRLERHINFEKDHAAIERVNLILTKNDNILTYKDLFALDIGTAIDMFRMANSTILGAQSKVTGFSTVLQRLGLKGITENFSKLAKKERKTDPLAQKMIRENFRFHSLLTACLTEEISALSSRFNHSELYSAGLFHDIGKLFFISYYPKIYSEILSANPGWRSELKDTENKVLGIDHAELGSMVFRKLGFSRIIQEACLHEKVAADKKNSFQNPKSVRIIHTADVFSHLILDGKQPVDFNDPYFDIIKETVAEYRVSVKVVIENSIKRIAIIARLLGSQLDFSEETIERVFEAFNLNNLRKKSQTSEMTEKIPSWRSARN